MSPTSVPVNRRKTDDDDWSDDEEYAATSGSSGGDDGYGDRYSGDRYGDGDDNDGYEDNGDGYGGGDEAGQEISVQDYHKTTSKRSSSSSRISKKKRLVGLTLLSNLFFIVGSALYVKMAAMSLRYSIEYRDLTAGLASSSLATAAAGTGVDVDGFAGPTMTSSGTTDGITTGGTGSTAGTDGTDVAPPPPSIDYDLLYWNDLPPTAQSAAQTLGYTQSIWDSGSTPENMDLWWDCLSEEQREAATLLGYDEIEWNGGDDAGGGRRRRMRGRSLQQRQEHQNQRQENEQRQDHRQAQEYDPEDVKYKNLYIAAAISFIMVGFLDCCILRKFYPLLFVVAGVFGLLSAIYTLRNPWYSVIFSSVSIHFFFLEAMALLWNCVNGTGDGGGGGHYLGGEGNDGKDGGRGGGRPKGLIVADVSFLIGSTIELVLSYFYLFDQYAEVNVEINSFNAAAQSLWLMCALIYTWYTLRWICRRKKEVGSR